VSDERPGPEKRARRERRSGAPDPTRVAVSLPAAARLLGAEGAVELETVRRNWGDVAGAQVAAHAQPTAFAHGVLTLSADHHAWAAELRLLSAELLKRLQARCPSVRAIVVEVNPGQALRW
jgi:predicted nucleic acid-binding Zn ribbon protein